MRKVNNMTTEKEEKTKGMECTICGKDMSGNYTGFVRFVKGKPVCQQCYEILANGHLPEDEVEKKEHDIV